VSPAPLAGYASELIFIGDPVYFLFVADRVAVNRARSGEGAKIGFQMPRHDDRFRPNLVLVGRKGHHRRRPKQKDADRSGVRPGCLAATLVAPRGGFWEFDFLGDFTFTPMSSIGTGLANSDNDNFTNSVHCKPRAKLLPGATKRLRHAMPGLLLRFWTLMCLFASTYDAIGRRSRDADPA
jgi:hypothetical protein